MTFEREKANKELAELCGIVLDFAQYPSDFFAGLRPDGTCDEAAVDGALLWKVMRAFPRQANICLHWMESQGQWCASCQIGGRRWSQTEFHAHPMMALYLCARAGSILKGEANQSNAAKEAEKGEPKPESCAGCAYAVYDGDELEGCTQDPVPPDDEPTAGHPCRYWEKGGPK